MWEYLYILPIGYFMLFILYTIIKILFEPIQKYLFCTVCFAYFTHLLLAFIFNYPIPIIALMMGISLNGVAYNLYDLLKIKKKKFIMDFFIIQTGIMLGGLLILIIWLKSKGL